MNQTNVCKFSLHRSSDLICTNFIYETQQGQATAGRTKEYLVGLVAGGEGVLHWDTQRHSLVPGDLFFLPPSVSFSVAGPSLSYFYICYHGRRADEFARRFELDSNRCVFGNNQALIPFWRGCQESANEKNLDLLCESVLLYSLAKLPPSKSRTDDALNTIIALTQEQFTQPDLSLTRIADKMGYSPKYLSAFFKKKKGVTFSQYLQDMRLRRAVFLMEEGLVSVKNIALLCGFQDPFYFSKVFSAWAGTPPRAYIASVQQNKPLSPQGNGFSKIQP